MSEWEECPRLPDVHAYWDRELPEEAAEDLIRHLGWCRICSTESRQIERFKVLLEVGDAPEPLESDRREALRAAVLAACAPPRRCGWGRLTGRSPTSRERTAIALRRAAWMLAPAMGVLLLICLGSLRPPTDPRVRPIAKAPDRPTRPGPLHRQVEKTTPVGTESRQVVENRGGPPPQKREFGSAIVERSHRPAVPQPKAFRSSVRLAQGGAAPGEAPGEDRRRPEAPGEPRIRKERVAAHRTPPSTPVVRQHLVVLAEGTALGSGTEPVQPEQIHIVASGGSDIPAGRVAIVQTNLQGDRP